MDVGKVCRRDLDLVELDESAAEAARRMQAREVGTLLVVDSDGRPSGILTDRDLALRVLAAGYDAAATRVRDVVSAPVQTMHQNVGIEEGLAALRAAGCRRMPVVDAEGRAVGIVTLDDLLVVLSAQLATIAKLLEGEAPHPG